MTRPRRSRRRPTPRGLDEISLSERAAWGTTGPIIEGDAVVLSVNTLPGSDRPIYHIWPDWDTFMRFYAEVRDAWSPDRPWVREESAVERLYQAWMRGEDLAAVRRAINAEERLNDPRLRLLGSGGPTR
jgi:hypothetical protein